MKKLIDVASSFVYDRFVKRSQVADVVYSSFPHAGRYCLLHRDRSGCECPGKDIEMYPPEEPLSVFGSARDTAREAAGTTVADLRCLRI
jgi:hypothetical protein